MQPESRIYTWLLAIFQALWMIVFISIWEIISKDTICMNAKIHFDRIPGKMKCLDCKNEYDLKGELIPCPKCASLNLKVIAGTEFHLDSIDIENDEEK